ncbi:uncharacterized protein ACIQIH_012715 isoform 1-T2 [Cyanocitta cristata]
MGMCVCITEEHSCKLLSAELVLFQEALLKLGLIWREKRGQENKKLAEGESGHEEGSVLLGLKLHLRSDESPQSTHKWPRSLKADGHHADSTSPICAVQCQATLLENDATWVLACTL